MACLDTLLIIDSKAVALYNIVVKSYVLRNPVKKTGSVPGWDANWLCDLRQVI